MIEKKPAGRQLSRNETHDLSMIIKDRTKVLRAHADEQAAACMADFERKLATVYAFDQDPLLARGWCRRHYNRWSKHGNPLTCLKVLSPRGAPMAWLLAHVTHQGDACLSWPFARFPDGRAHMQKNGRTVKPTRLMCEMIYGAPPSPKHEAAHSCGKGHEACVSPHHLYWATKAENDADKIRHGTIAKGERLPQAKLTARKVRRIRELAASGVQGQHLAKQFRVNPSCISKIVKRVHWRHV